MMMALNNDSAVKNVIDYLESDSVIQRCWVKCRIES